MEPFLSYLNTLEQSQVVNAIIEGYSAIMESYDYESTQKQIDEAINGFYKKLCEEKDSITDENGKYNGKPVIFKTTFNNKPIQIEFTDQYIDTCGENAVAFAWLDQSVTLQPSALKGINCDISLIENVINNFYTQNSIRNTDGRGNSIYQILCHELQHILDPIKSYHAHQADAVNKNTKQSEEYLYGCELSEINARSREAYVQILKGSYPHNRKALMNIISEYLLHNRYYKYPEKTQQFVRRRAARIIQSAENALGEKFIPKEPSYTERRRRKPVKQEKPTLMQRFKSLFHR